MWTYSSECAFLPLFFFSPASCYICPWAGFHWTTESPVPRKYVCTVKEQIVQVKQRFLELLLQGLLRKKVAIRGNTGSLQRAPRQLGFTSSSGRGRLMTSHHFQVEAGWPHITSGTGRLTSHHFQVEAGWPHITSRRGQADLTSPPGRGRLTSHPFQIEAGWPHLTSR